MPKVSLVRIIADGIPGGRGLQHVEIPPDPKDRELLPFAVGQYASSAVQDDAGFGGVHQEGEGLLQVELDLLGVVR